MSKSDRVMVLQELGEKLLGGLQKLANARTIDDTFFREFMIEICKALQAADVAAKTVFEFSKAVKAKVNLSELPPGISARKIIEKVVLEELVNILDPDKDAFEPIKGRPNVVMMVGLQGAGKTTTCTKLGSYYKRRGWKVGVVAADTFRAGAREQLMQNAQLVNIDYYVDFANQDPVEVALAGVNKFKKDRFDMIIVDTSGRHMQEAALFEEMKQLEEAIDPDDVIFVLDGTIGQAAFDQASAFARAVDVGSIIITKLDSSAKGGGALSAVAATGSPIAFYGTGEDSSCLEVFDPSSFVSRMLGFGDVTAFAKKMEEIDMDKQMEVANQIKKGKFTFREMYTQYQTILEMGNIQSLIESMGMSKFMPKGISSDNMTDNIKRILVVIDSMTDEEMENPQLFKDEKRKLRLCRGCGMPAVFIQYVIDEQKRWQKMFGRMGASTIDRLTQVDPSKGMDERTLKKEIQNVAKSMDPRMLNNIGGLGGLQNMMRASMMPKRK